MNDFTKNEKLRAIAWKSNTTALPDAAKVPAPYVGKDGTAGPTAYDFCLPAELADHNLLPKVREPALALFAELEIPWHAGTPAGPSNHLLSSQVQCVNALMPMVTDPSRIQRAFGAHEVLEIEPGRFLTFEYIGPRDYFGEAPHGTRTRGAHCTSVDAAFLHRLPDGTTELVLVEWKYTESYRPRTPDPAKDAVRAQRYAASVADPDGPVLSDVLPFDLLLDEPLYQLVRQQLLAHALELDGVADRVRVVHVLPKDNAAYQESLQRPEQRALGATVSEVWQKLLRRPDRFTSMDHRVFWDPEVTSREYELRYSPLVAWDQAELLALYGVEDESGLDDAVFAAHGFDGDVTVSLDGIELQLGRAGIWLEYPISIFDVTDAVTDLEREMDE